MGDRQDKVVMNGVLHLTARRGPNRGVAIMNLIDHILDKVIFNLKDTRPEDRARPISSGRPKRGGVEIFGFIDAGEEMIFVSGNVPGSMSDQTFVDSVKVSDSEPPILFGLTDIVPRSEGNGIGRAIILNTSPPKSSNDGGDFPNESFREEHSGHIVNRDGSKN